MSDSTPPSPRPIGPWNEEQPTALSSQPEVGGQFWGQMVTALLYLPFQAQEVGE